MSLQIITGKRAGAVRGVIYGTEGIGKSTLASQLPKALIIDTEDGTGQLETPRTLALDWRSIEYAIKELIADAQGFKSIVIDSADWMEKALIEHMLKQSGKKSIEDFGYGKGYTILQEHVVRFLGDVDQLIAKGINFFFVAHSKVVRTSPPDQTDGFDRYELKLTKQVGPLIKEWADVILFCNYQIQVVEGTDGRLKAQGGKERLMYAMHSAAWDAKNRFGLPDQMKMEFAQISRIFSQTVTPALIAKTNEEPMPVLASAAQIVDLKKLFASSAAGKTAVENALANANAVGLDELLYSEAEKLLGAGVESDITAWLDANSEAVNAYLIRVQWLAAGQAWRDLTPDNFGKITSKLDKFAKAAGIPQMAGKLAA